MAEWSMAVVLKTTAPETVPGVRIPLPPPNLVGRSGWVVLGSPSCALRATTSGNSMLVDVEGRRWQAAFADSISLCYEKGKWRPEALIQR